MGWFYLSWIIVSAVYVSCQELTTSLPEGNDACTRNEVNFTCTIRSSPNLTTLTLSWSSDEYIGQGDTLLFTSDTMPGKNFSSVINDNVTAILTSNTTMDGVPALVSELRIVNANQNSMIRCVTNNDRSDSTNFIVPGFPNSPQNVTARQVSQDCNLLLMWSHPTNTDSNGLTYKIYVPSRDIVIANVSDTNHEFVVINCRDDDVRVLVAAVNRFGCEGQNSSAVQVQPLPLEMPTVPEPQLDSGAIAGIVLAVVVLVLVVVMLVGLALAVKAYNKKKRQKKELWTTIFFEELFNGLKIGAQLSELVHESRLEPLWKTSDKDIQEGLIFFISEKLTSATCIESVLYRLVKEMHLPVMSTFDRELEKAGSDVTMKKLLEEAKDGQLGKLTRKLKVSLKDLTEKLSKTEPEGVKNLLKKFFEDLKEKTDELNDIIDKLEEMKKKVGASAQDHLCKVIEMLKDANFMKEWKKVTQDSESSSQEIADAGDASPPAPSDPPKDRTHDHSSPTSPSSRLEKEKSIEVEELEIGDAGDSSPPGPPDLPKDPSQTDETET